MMQSTQSSPTAHVQAEIKAEGDLKATVLCSLIALILCFGLSDGWLLVRLKRAESKIAALQFENETLAESPSPGQVVPLVQGISVNTKQPSAVKLASHASLVLLVFSESCRFCEQNWSNWAQLFSPAKTKFPVYLLTSDSSLSDSYVKNHPLLAQREGLYGVDPEVMMYFRVASTPQTILVVDGKVKQDWVGLLTTKDLADISASIAPSKSL